MSGNRKINEGSQMNEGIQMSEGSQMNNTTSAKLRTTVIKDDISRCEDIEELKEKIFPQVSDQHQQWAEKVAEIIEENNYTKKKFAELCGVSRVSVDKWCKGSIPKNRETFLRIGMAAHYDVEKMNQLLKRYGRYPGLYSKSLEDCICIFVISHDYGDEAMEKYRYILNEVKDTITRPDENGESEDISTDRFDARLSEVEDEDGLGRFIAENVAMFAMAYHKFYAYVNVSIKANYVDADYAESINDMAQIQGWSSSLKQCVSAIRQKKWYPTRNKIISLGIHLSMDHEQIDEMLELAHMEPLCAKNLFESVIMFILDDASLNDILDSESEDYDPDELCNYARRVLKEFNMPEVDEFISELNDYEEDSENDAW
ncbi:MAG: helix-turn-helix domain-containing protein [Lachnospiraceae bacterium]|nr:helix-turn-helix domain-containing protein [Lachnospiraceae bacterium]